MSRFVYGGNEILPGTIILTSDGTVSPKDYLRVIINISGGGTVTISDGVDVTQKMELVNISSSDCTIAYKGSDGLTSTTLCSKQNATVIWSGSFWNITISVPVTGIDDNNLPFAYNIDSLVKPEGVIHITGEFKDGTPFDYGLGRLVSISRECSYSTDEQLTGGTWIDGKPIYRKVVIATSPSSASAVTYNLGIANPDTVINVIVMIDSRITSPFYASSSNLSYWYLESNRTQMGFTVKDSSWFNKPVHIIIEYTKTTD